MTLKYFFTFFSFAFMFSNLSFAADSLCELGSRYRLYSEINDSQPKDITDAAGEKAVCIGEEIDKESNRRKVEINNKIFYIDQSGVKLISPLSVEKYIVENNYVLWDEKDSSTSKGYFYETGLEVEFAKLILDNQNKTIIENDRIRALMVQKRRNNKWVYLDGWISVQGIRDFKGTIGAEKNLSNDADTSILTKENDNFVEEKNINQLFIKHKDEIMSVTTSSTEGFIRLAKEETALLDDNGNIIHKLLEHQRIGSVLDRKCTSSDCRLLVNIRDYFNIPMMSEVKKAWVKERDTTKIPGNTYTLEDAVIFYPDQNFYELLKKDSMVLAMGLKVCFEEIGKCFEKVKYKIQGQFVIGWVEYQKIIDPTESYIYTGTEFDEIDNEIDSNINVDIAEQSLDTSLYFACPVSKDETVTIYDELIEDEVKEIPFGESLLITNAEPIKKVVDGKRSNFMTVIVGDNNYTVDKNSIVKNLSDCYFKQSTGDQYKTEPTDYHVCTDEGGSLLARDENQQIIRLGQSSLKFNNGSLLTRISNATYQHNGYTYFKVKSVDSESGWVASQFLTKDKKSCPSLQVSSRYACTSEGTPLNVRDKNNSWKKIGSLESQTKVKVFLNENAKYKGNDYLKVEFNNGKTTGWVAEDFLNTSLEGCKAPAATAGMSTGTPSVSNSSAMKNFIKIMGIIPYRRCTSQSWSSCGRKKSNKSLYLCARYVKIGIHHTGLSRNYISCNYAKNCGGEMAKYGWKNIGAVNPRKTPYGAVILYSNNYGNRSKSSTGCHPAGHIEAHIPAGFSSDYISSRPVTESAYGRRCRKVLSVYVK